MTALANNQRTARPSPRIESGAAQSRPSGVRPWVLAEGLAGALGFTASVTLARRLGPSGFADFEFAAALTGWLLVLVRGGIDLVAYREAARRPRLIRRLTDLLIGLRLVAAGAGYAVVVGFAFWLGSERGAVVAVAGLTLFPSALAADLAPRSRGRFGWVALIQAVRAIGYATLVFALILGSGQALRASWCAVAAEGIAALLYAWPHTREFGIPRPRFQRRAWLVLARRGLIAGLMRLGRVGLYAAGVLTLGLVASADLGPFAASRRLVFGLVTLGLIVPASLSPVLARTWVAGVAPTRRVLARASSEILVWAWPATVGLALLGHRIMPTLFGSAYEGTGPVLASLAVRLAPLLLASLYQTALVACRREFEAMILVLAQVALAALILPIAASQGGPIAVGWSLAGIEALGSVATWGMLRRLQIAPCWQGGWIGHLVASALMGLVCLWLGAEPLAVVIGCGALTYAVTLILVDRRWRLRALGWSWRRIG